jgi:hypothetical protein
MLLKILSSLLALVIVSYYFLIAISIGASSHNIPEMDRKSADTNAELALYLGIVSIILIWIPWKLIFSRTKTH